PQHPFDGGGGAARGSRRAARPRPRDRGRDDARARRAGAPPAPARAAHRAASARRLGGWRPGRGGRRRARAGGGAGGDERAQRGPHDRFDGVRPRDPRARARRGRRDRRRGAPPPRSRGRVLPPDGTRAPRRRSGARAVIARALLASVRKDWRLLARDRIGLFFMAVAPIVVIAVAGLSLASLYGASPRGDTAYVLPVVDEDGGELGATLRRRLADEPAVELRFVDRQAALAAISRREAGAALVLPPGTSAALRHGEPARLLLLTDPVKYLEIANVRNLVQELRHAVGGEALDRARARLERARAHALRARQRMERLLARVRAELERAAAEGREGRRRLAAEIDAASARAADVERRLRDRMAAAASERSEAARERVAAELEPLAQFLRDVARYRSEFDAWLMAARAAAGSFADRLPAPPSPPAVPPAVAAFESGGAEKLADRLVGAPAALGGDAVDWLPPGELRGILSLPKVPPAVATAVPSAEKLASRLPAPPPAVRLPRLLEIDEQSVTGAP